MQPYHKIETVYIRDMEGTKKLMPGFFRNPTVEYLKDNQWLFTEKIDGTNIRVHWDGHKVIYGGRTDNAQIPTPLMYALNEKFMGTVNEQMFEQKFGETPVTLYGEGYGPKIQKGGGLYRDEPGFILFDVLIGDVWLQRADVVEIGEAMGIDVVPLVMTGTIQEAVDYVRSQPNCIHSKQPKKAEGLVGRPVCEMKDRQGKRIIVKIKADDFWK